MEAVILAGGFGKRLRPLTSEMPKSMIKINDKPIIDWQIRWLRNNGISDIIIAVGYKKEIIMDYLHDQDFSINIRYVVEDKPLDTGGALKNARKELRNGTFLVINGDILTNMDITKIFNTIDENIGTIATVPLQSPFGIVSIDEKQNIIGFIEKPRIMDYWINAGVYYLTNEIFDYLPDVGSIERETFPRLAKENKLKAIKYKDVYWRSIDSHKDIEEANNEFKQIGLA